MQITIHRANQIGGCITIIEHDDCRIIIDLGSNLPGSTSEELTEADVKALTENVNAIFFTHYHGDHVGLHHLVDTGIPQFIGAGAREVMLCKYETLDNIPGEDYSKHIASAKLMGVYVAGRPVKYNGADKIKVTPFFVSHSAFDAYMLKIECCGMKILHTGDFRRHGYLGKGLDKILPIIGDVDVLITEGTMLGRKQEIVVHENDIKRNIINQMTVPKYLYALCSSTDIDRLASFHAACKERDFLFVVDSYQDKVLDIFAKYAGDKSDLFKFDHRYKLDRPYDEDVLKELKTKGFLMLIRENQLKLVKAMKKKFNDKESWLIYSVWGGYAEQGKQYSKENVLELRSLFEGHILDGSKEGFHTSGHADLETLGDLCSMVNPSIGVIPIHKDASTRYDMPKTQRYKIFTSSEKVSDRLNIVLM